MTTTAETLYYICRSDNVHIGIFGTATHCARWYLTYDGADYRLYTMADMQVAKTEEEGALDARLDQGAGQVWNVAFRPPDSTEYQEALVTVNGEDEQAADNALRSYVLQFKLLAARHRDEDFYMIEAQHALPSLIRPTEMRAIYDLSQSAPANDDTVREWFWNAAHTEAALLKMVDLIAARRYLPLPWLAAAQLRTQISAGTWNPEFVNHYEDIPQETLLLH